MLNLIWNPFFFKTPKWQRYFFQFQQTHDSNRLCRHGDIKVFSRLFARWRHHHRAGVELHASNCTYTPIRSHSL